MDIITEALTGPFQYSFMLRALIVSVLVGVMCPVLGVYVVVRGLGFMGDALAHSVLPGMVAAFMLGISPFFGAIPMALATALLSGYLIRRAGISEDTSVGILFAGLFALGVVLLTAVRGISINLEDILLGQVLGVSQADVFVTLGLAGAVLALTWGLHKELVFASFDPSGAAVIGLPTDKLEYLLLGLLAVVVVLALQAVGIVLVISMLITPAAAALLVVRNFARAMAVAVLIGVASAVAGLYLSFHYNLPSGPVMALVATGFFLLALAWKQRPAGLMPQQGA
jgi:manganese/iron transport system permease protein